MKTAKMLLTLLAALLVLSPATAFAHQVSIPDLNADSGSPVTISVNIDTALGIAGFQFTITYNTAVLNCTNAVAGSLTSGWNIIANPGVPGEIQVAGFNFTAELGAVPGSLTILQCTAQNPGTTPVAFTYSLLSNLNSEEIAHDIDNGTLTVTGDCTPTGPDTDCNGQDEDCDGTPDDGYVPTPATCGKGVCESTGQNTCQNGAIVNTCTPEAPTETSEVSCDDQLDNDCDGATDSADSNCTSTCNPTGPDTNCNGQDEDCDGTPDNGYVSTPTTCGVGICADTGENICESGQIVNICTPGVPQTEGPNGSPTCSDSLDNDCDGLTDNVDTGCTESPVSKCFDNIDNNNDGKTDCEDSKCSGKTDGACDTGKPGVCAAGTYTCEGGAKICKQNVPSKAETIAAGKCFDQLDNDCDGDVDADDSGCTSGTLINANVDFTPSILNVISHGKTITARIELPHPYSIGEIDIESIVLRDGDTIIDTYREVISCCCGEECNVLIDRKTVRDKGSSSPATYYHCDGGHCSGFDRIPHLTVKFDWAIVTDYCEEYLDSEGKTVEVMDFKVEGALTTGDFFEGFDKVLVNKWSGTFRSHKTNK